MPLKLKKILLFSLLFMMSTVSFTYSQVVYVPINDVVYDYLDRMNLRGIIQLDSEVKPFSRLYISKKIAKINSDRILLNNVELELLKWYQEEYAYELGSTSKQRWRLVSYEDSLFSFRLSPILGYKYANFSKSSGQSRWIGARMFVTASNWFGGALDMRNIGKFGYLVDMQGQKYTDERGADYWHTKEIEFSDVRSQINFNWEWGTISLKKDYIEWGNSYFGNLILSDKAPSYPHISFEIKPTKWFRFYSIFGSLHSGVIDSTSSIVINEGTQSEILHERFVKKYIVANMLTFTPVKWLDVSLGNSFVYAGNFRPEMLIPFNFYKYMDRETGKKDVEDGNGTVYLDVAVRFLNSFKFYSTLFIDVDSRYGKISTVLLDAPWIGYTIGLKKVDFIAQNLDVVVEYTKVRPWVYEHKYENLTNYKHLEYTLGHWIGQNADHIKIQFYYQPIRGLILRLFTEYLRVGGLKEIYYAYDESDEIFLYPPVKRDKYIGLTVNYEVFHELFVESSFVYSSISDEDEGRTSEFLRGKNKSVSVSLYYGIP